MKPTELRDYLMTKVGHLTPRRRMELAYKDELTGVWNRRALQELCHEGPVAIVDLDNFKWINDNLGYREGDIVLQQLADSLQHYFPEATYRLGGDEFVVVAETREALLAGILLAQGDASRKYVLGTQHYVAGPARFSFGIGDDLTRADRMLKEDKKARLQMGKRVSPGAVPCNVSPRLGLIGV